MDFVALSQQCAPAVAYQTMSAIVRTESAFRPLAIGVNGGTRLVRQPQTKAEAVVTAKWLIANGYNIDMGLGQVNSANLPKIGLSVEDAFDPCKNLAAAASILFGNYQAAKNKGHTGQAALHAALSAYNTGSLTRGFANGYVQKVVASANVTAAVPAIDGVTPIPLTGAKGSQPARLRPQRQEAPVRIAPAEAKRAEDRSDSTDVYAADPAETENVMVF